MPVAPPRALRWQILGSLIVAILREWRRRRASRRDLAYLDERILRDIGLDPEKARRDRSDADYYEATLGV
jgi:uncharacterized protein YjiS (DUF1127 family)